MKEWLLDNIWLILMGIFAGGSKIAGDINKNKKIEKSVNKYLDNKLYPEKNKKKEGEEKK